MSLQYKYGLVIINVLILLVYGCQNQADIQCNLIIETAHHTTQKLSYILQAEVDNSQDLQIWSQAIDIFNEGINQLESLNIPNEQLMDYQDELANLWQVYAQTTHKAIKARKLKSFEALTEANQEVQVLDQKVQRVTRQINDYCYD